MSHRNAPSAGRAAPSPKPALAQVKGKTLRELAYEELRRALIAGHFAPGEAVTIADIARRLNIGIMPAREAIQQLASQGAFEFLANRSVRVPRIGRSGLDDLFEARILIETDLVRRAAHRDGCVSSAPMYEALDRLEKSTASGNAADSLAGNYAFHFTIYAASQANTLIDIAERLWLRMSPLHVAVFRAEESRQSAFLATLPAHRTLADALDARDAPSAERIFRDMLIHSRDWHRANIMSGQ